MSILFNLSEEERKKAKQYANNIKESKKALFELINKVKNRETQDSSDKMKLESYPVMPKNISDFAKKKGILNKITTIAKWLSEVNKKIVGGTAIGKNYNTIVLDITYQGSEIHYNIEDGGLEVNGESIPFDKQKFLEAIQ